LTETAINVDTILDSLASSTRLKILKLLSKKELGYSELMDSLGMEKNRDAGKFSYHLKKLLNSKLIEVNRETGKYRVSKTGLLVLDNLDKLEKDLGTKELLIVRRSENIIEPFDKTKIINSLVKEANLTPKLASEIASIVEEKLHNLKIEYLTSPLIRELVNTVLLDMGLEKYRHRLSRIGMPIYDVSKLFRKVSVIGDLREFMEESSKSIMREYCLQNFLSRNIAEMHLTGRIDLYPLDNWLTGVIARSYQAPSDEEEVFKILAEISASTLNIRHEINLRLIDKKGLENTLKIIRHIVSTSLLRGRYLSITIEHEDLVENFPRIMEKIRMLDQSIKKIRYIVVVDEPSYSELLKLDELFRSSKLQYVITNSDESLFYGLRLPLEKPSSDIHAVFTLNLLLLALESNKDVDYLLERIRELTMYGFSALSKRARMFKQVYGRRYSKQIYYVSSLYGLTEAVKTIHGVVPYLSKESSSLLSSIIQYYVENLKKYPSEMGKLTLGSRTPKSSAKRLFRLISHKVSMDDHEKISSHGYLISAPIEKFRNIEERALFESRIASYIDGGYYTVVKGARRKKIIEDAVVLFEELSKTGKPFTIKIDEAGVS